MKCCVKNCPAVNDKPHPMLHLFPRDIELFKQWCINLGREAFINEDQNRIRKSYRVCDIHFSEEWKFEHNRNRTNLICGAIPTVNLPGPEPVPALEAIAPNETTLISQSSVSGKENFNGDLSLETNAAAFENPLFESLSSDLFGDDRGCQQVCRICLRRLTLSDVKNKLSERDMEPIANMITLVLPDLDLNMCSKNTCCQRCTALLTYSYELKTTWLMAEDKLQKVIQSKRKEKGQPESNTNTEDSNADFRGVDQPLPQPFCPIYFNNFVRRGPQRQYKEYGPGPYQCEECGLIFKQRATFVKHVSRHKDGTPKSEKFMCEKCGIQLLTWAGLKNHIKTHSLLPKIYECNRCRRVFSRQGNLRIHMAFRHTGGRETNTISQCHICGKRLSSRTNLRHHLVTHTGNKKFQCGKCTRRFYTKAHLQKHQRVHDDAMESCPFCGKAIKYEQALQCHIRVFHMDGGQYICDICDRPFVKKLSLDSHKIRVHGFSVQRKDLPRKEVVS